MLVTAAKTVVSANLCAVNSRTQMPCSMSQMRTVSSKLPDARRLLSELQSRQDTPFLPSQRVSYAVTDTDRQRATGEGPEGVEGNGYNVTERERVSHRCPVKVLRHSEVSMSHSFRVSSLEALTRWLELCGSNLTSQTVPLLRQPFH